MKGFHVETMYIQFYMHVHNKHYTGLWWPEVSEKRVVFINGIQLSSKYFSFQFLNLFPRYLIYRLKQSLKLLRCISKYKHQNTASHHDPRIVESYGAHSEVFEIRSTNFSNSVRMYCSYVKCWNLPIWCIRAVYAISRHWWGVNPARKNSSILYLLTIPKIY